MYKYDFGLSFAGEDFLCAQDLADRLRVDGINIFYDPDEEAELWGQDLDADVTIVMRSSSFCCIAVC
jgi:hypothetical protein